MGINFNVEVNNENEFNQQLQMYLAQGYTMQSNFNGTAILKKKSYSTGVLIILILFFFPAAIIYYLVASDDVVTIRNNNGQQSNDSANVGTTTESYDSYCDECGHGLFKDSKFCPGCGRDLSETDESSALAVDHESVKEEDEISLCNNCGINLSASDKFCPNCGQKVITTDDEE